MQLLRRFAFPVLLGLLVSGSFAVSGRTQSSLRLSDTRPRQGTIVRLELTGTDCKPTVHWNDERIPLWDVDGTTIGYFGVGLETDPGTRSLRLTDRCENSPYPDRISVQIREGEFPVQRLTVEDTGKVQLSEKDLRRHRRESERIDAALNRRTDTRHWRSPFHSPVREKQFRPGDSFGSRRIINGHPRSPHSGEDYSATTGDPIYAINHGRVALTGDFFFSGKGVFLDHGHGLTSMYFHLSEIDVEEGELVRAGTRLGSAGATGRVTGPHLHLGVQWHDARVDPDRLFFDDRGLFRGND